MILALLLAAAAPAPAPSSIGGRWLTAEGKAVVEIAPCADRSGPALCGRIAQVLKPRPGGPPTDINNPDPALRGRPMAGLVILTEFRPDDDRWRGRIYDPESGRTYRAELTRDGRLLSVKGCWGPFCRTQSWTALAK